MGRCCCSRSRRCPCCCPLLAWSFPLCPHCLCWTLWLSLCPCCLPLCPCCPPLCPCWIRWICRLLWCLPICPPHCSSCTCQSRISSEHYTKYKKLWRILKAYTM